MKITRKALISEELGWGDTHELNPILSQKGGMLDIRGGRRGFIFRPECPDCECWEDSRIEAYIESVRRLVRGFDPAWRLYQYSFRRPHGKVFINDQFMVAVGGERMEGCTPADIALDCIFDPNLDMDRHEDYLRIGRKFAKVLTMNRASLLEKVPLPELSHPDYLRPLREIDGHYFLCLEWQQYTYAEARKKLEHLKRSHNDASAKLGYKPTDERMKDGERLASVDEIREGQTLLKSGATVGQMSLIATCFGDTLAEAEESASRLVSAANQLDLKLHIQTRGACKAYAAAVAGNEDCNSYYLNVLGQTVVDFGFWFGTSSGDPVNRHLEKPCLMKFQTNQKTEYSFSPHVGAIGHWLCAAMTGAGKSVLANNILYHLRKAYDPWIFIIDWGGSYEAQVIEAGGRHRKVGYGMINPFACESNAENVEFLTVVMQALLQQDATPLTVSDQAFLLEGVRAALDRGCRSIRSFEDELSSRLKERLHYWLVRYGDWISDDENELEVDEFESWDFVGLERYKGIAPLLIMSLIHQLEKVVQDPRISTRLKCINVDEAHNALREPLLCEPIQQSVRTFRKYNGMVGLLSQSLGDFRNSPIAEVIVTNFPTQFFGHNPNLDYDLYCNTFHLTRKEAELIPGLETGQFLLHRPKESKTVRNVVDPRELAMFGTDPKEIAARNEARGKYGKNWMDNLAVGDGVAIVRG